MSENKFACDKLVVGETGPILFEYDGRYTFKILRNDVWTRLPMKRGYLYDKFNVIAAYNYLEKGFFCCSHCCRFCSSGRRW